MEAVDKRKRAMPRTPITRRKMPGKCPAEQSRGCARATCCVGRAELCQVDTVQPTNKHAYSIVERRTIASTRR
eukprot:5901757-Alexandrium_andersonii.AAC.1